MMTKYKLLFAEDVPEDMELAEHELRKSGLNFESRRVDNQFDFIKQLNSFHPDLIISDYSMPTFTGMDALKIVKDYSPYIPVIIHTGSINEETAVNCMKAGAFDYVLKEKILRLPYAVREAIDKSSILKQNKESQIALKTSEEKYKRLFNSISQGVFYIHENGQISMINPSAKDIFKLNCDNFKIEDFQSEWEFFSDNGSMIDLKASLLDNKEVSQIKKEFILKAVRKKDNLVKFLLINIIREAEESDELFKVLVVIEDISLRKKFEEDIIQAKIKAEESDKLKTAFLANLSHEVRTPMNAILGFSQLLSDFSLDADAHFFIQTIQENSVKLLGIITDIIEISKIETEQVVLYKNDFELDSLQKYIHEFYKSPAESKGLNLLTSGFEKNIIITSDEQKVKKVLSCLIDNAIKFTDSGIIRVSCSLHQNSLEIHVVDTGIGISSDNENLIFERFRQGDEGYNRKHGGTGLGLSISKAYIEAIGGKILYQPSGKGSDFSFYIPVQWKHSVHDQVLPNSDSIPDYSSFTFLIAEDDATNFTYIIKLLAPTGANIIGASDGEDAIEKYNNNKTIDLILMDIKMPIMNGYEATAEIRKTNQSIPIIATTAYAMSGDKEKCLESGFNNYISKPIKKTELFEVISNSLSINYIH